MKPSSAKAAAKRSEERVYEFVPRDPSKGYLDTNLWIPKSKANSAAIKAGLTFELKENKLCLCYETEHHLVVPREYLAGKAPWFDLVDLRPPVERVHYSNDTSPRDEIQVEALAHLVRATSGILHLACGRGKTWLALKKAALHGTPTLIVVYQTGTILQWQEQAEMFLGVKASVVQGDRQEWFDSPIVIASLSTLISRRDDLPLDVRERFGLIIYDEVHHLSAPEMSTTATMFFGDRIGLTATPYRDDGTEQVYFQHLGPIFYTNTTQDLAPEIHFIQLGTVLDLETIKDRRGEICTGYLHAALGVMPKRVQIITDHAVRAYNAGRRILVLGHSLSGLHALHESIQAALPDVEVGLITGKVKQDKRRPIFVKCPIVVGTTSIASEALDAPKLDTVFFTTLFKTNRILVQGLGRILRPEKDKKRPIAAFFEDRGIGPCKKWGRNLRADITAELGYDIKLV